METSLLKVELCVGAYEHAVCGLHGHVELANAKNPGPDQCAILKTSFARKSHTGPVKSVASRGQWLLSSGSDEQIRVIDLESRREAGVLDGPQATVTHLALFAPRGLVAATADGKLLLWRAGPWRFVRELRAHKGPVLGLAVHPSGRLAISAGKDRLLRLWDLEKGSAAATLRLRSGSANLDWSPGPSPRHYLVATPRALLVYSARSGRLVTEATSPVDILTARFLDRNRLVAATADGRLIVFDVKTGESIHEVIAHSTRVRALDVVCRKQPPAILVASAATNGEVRLWDGNILDSPIAQATLSLRLSSVCFIEPNHEHEFSVDEASHLDEAVDQDSSSDE